MNFLDSVIEWDYYYAQSDDPKIYDEGERQLETIVELYKALPDSQKLLVTKLSHIQMVANGSQRDRTGG